MIFAGLVAVAALQAAPLGRDDRAHDQLLSAANQIMDAEEALAFTLGKCAAVYPSGPADPFVVKARKEVEEIGLEELTMSVVRLRQLRFAEGAEAGARAKPTIRACIGDIDGRASDLQQHAQGFRGLVGTLSQR